MNVKDVKELLQLIKDFDLSEFEIKQGDLELYIKRGKNDNEKILANGMPVILSQNVSSQEQKQEPANVQPNKPAQEDPKNIGYVTSPMVGTFYRSSSPDSSVFVDIGSKISSETVVCIIEAMKVMNEVQSEIKGTILEVLVENGKSVEFGQKLFKVQLS